ncbi:MAG TPA: outer membrane lipoprotein carrier protein LolA [Rhodocyclaceae bacterium]|nr:outer membrane lipoprotein carrier protein LolA [Rhodocyclaceae bacterium]
MTSRHPRFAALCLGLWLAVTSLAGDAAPNLAQLATKLDKAGVIHAGFAQTKILQALKRPIRTSGRMVFARGQGVLWQIDKPYQASYALSAEHVVEIGPDGSRKVRAAREVPALAHIGRVFEALFQGDAAALEQYFQVTVGGSPERWRVDLAPKPELVRFLKGISAQGGQFLDSIEVHEAQGDVTRIEFRDSRLDAPLTDAEARLLRGE